ncbi:hypothetical protein OJ997_00605 [Solirubrobacter phytolaccae]|uniref:Uncharacterized protein n=1 Tax=Solirubrobacter phytolaccae TaxID=1404360 RepID=A0A9X3N5S7_9ACTN|nr:hypothetical protein [Solirubrobacter phytolaccae]MDA0178779.1 hypothetical protein [Solirubrobacter phytolaccae]
MRDLTAAGPEVAAATHAPEAADAARAPAPAERVLALQRSAGNCAVASMLGSNRTRALGRATADQRPTAPAPEDRRLLARIADERQPAPRCACGGLIGADGMCTKCRQQAQGAGSPTLARYTADPNREIGLTIAEQLSKVWPDASPELTALVMCMMRFVPSIAVPLHLYRVARLAYSVLFGPQAKFEEYMTEAIASGVFGGAATLCDCIPSRAFLPFAREGLAPYPLATSFFEHYVAGAGSPRTFDLSEMLTEEPDQRSNLSAEIVSDAGTEGMLRMAFIQGAYRTKKWQYALGGIEQTWFRIRDDAAARDENAERADGCALVHIRVEDPYWWHPDDWNRRNPCLHSAMENMKAGGAKEFLVTAETDLRLKLPKAKIPLPGAADPAGGSTSGPAPVAAPPAPPVDP